MRIFLSHSSRQKPLIREMKRYLPDHINVWIDEKDLLVGDGIEASIREAIEADTDFVILFVDSHAVESGWVLREIQWALQHEAKLGRTFVLPIVIDKDAWDKLENSSFKIRKYISCHDFTETGIQVLSNNLVAHLFAWLSRDLANSRKSQELDSSARMLAEADKYLVRLAHDIRLILHANTSENPLPIKDLFMLLQSRADLRLSSEAHLSDLLARLRQQGYLSGLVFQRDRVFVKEEHFGWKATLFAEDKRLIARKAVDFIQSGQTLALDAGSTTIEIAREISRGLKLRFWDRLTVITDSISTANELTTTAAELGLEDDDQLLRIVIAGGRIRPNTLAIVNDEKLFTSGTVPDLVSLLEGIGRVDVAFAGTNGVSIEAGFTTQDMSEVRTKAAMLKSAKRKFIVTDSSKFGVRHHHTFATFDEDVSIITNKRGHLAIVEEYEAVLAQTRTKLVFAE
jgi:DeoR/GlpR family transcriptional regulator of sugar metabolism